MLNINIYIYIHCVLEKRLKENLKMEDDKKIFQPWPYMNLISIVTSIATKLATVGIIWGWGYMNWNIAWLVAPVVVSVFHGERSKDRVLRRLTAQATVMAKEKHIIMSRMDELPSWVYFPDFDRAEWLNRILYKVWPSMNHYVRTMCKQTIQPAIVERLSEYKMKGFQFERLVLGRIPPKVCGVKVYSTNTSRNEIILDMDLLYAGDCDVNFTIGNLRGGIKDFQIRGMIRVVMKPMISVMPLIGGLQIFFLNNPAIDFNLVGAVDVLELPGFNDILRKTILEQVAAIVVLPNKLVIRLSEEIPPEILKTPEPEGVLRIHVVQAKHLMKKDIGLLGKGKSDPYAIITVGAQEFRTKTIDNTVDPKWDYWCECAVTSSIAQQLTIHIWDYDGTKEDESLGRATVEVSRVQKKGTIDTWVALEFAKHGMVHLRLTWLKLSTNIADLQTALHETQKLQVSSLSTAILILYIDSAKSLPCLQGSKQPDVYLEASVDSKKQRTVTIPRSCDPVWEHGFTFLVTNPETSVLHIKVWDEKSGTVIGTMSYNLSLVMRKDNLEVTQQPYNLQDAQSKSKLVLSMMLRILRYEDPEPTTEEDNDDDHDINELNKRIERQESNISNTASNSVPPSPLQKQPSKESVNCLASGIISTDETMNSTTKADELVLAERDTIISTVSTEASASPGVIHRNPSITSSSGASKLGRIQLTLRYTASRQTLVVVVHKIANLPLPLNDPTDVPDPYVKLYLMRGQHKELKRRTAVISNNCNPVFDEQLEFVIPRYDSDNRTLKVSVCTQKGFLSSGSNVIGQVHLNLSEMDLVRPVTNWYDLSPKNKD
ncbi:extended synaptotagmin-1 [Orussus abietinus]|uniref:extended synaptotagmin-1 n=1 Tax=Orussus abietinus TaxID=222816 RepID=UPI0006268153|nr:extended synaptotagmin-1 [Orussus abietinus]XP_012275470.1 extended synaptotagmin-1 [Orussus abietinus]XP_012275472.1 extended synaptotagmin-1 [Orussus abietinus]XP_012275473.1 extended synaptotagmin-1 [Orussus abietinus]XP_012275474.1 extended synaptotagmin-1 [Orussus abietinus]